MATKTVQAGPFLGINNKLPVHKLAAGDNGAFVRDAVNVDLTDAGTFQRRPGHALAQAASRGRALWSDGTTAYYASAGNLMRFDGTAAAVVASLADPAAAPSFASTPRGVVWSDGSTLQLIEGSASRALAIPSPNPEPDLTALSDGALAAGAYLVAFANVDAAGERSALTPLVSLAVPANGSIQVDFPTGRTLSTLVFVSACDGAQLFRAETVPADQSSLRLPLVTTQGQPITDEVEWPMPAGSIVRYHRGKLLVVVENLVFYSQPFAYGVLRPAKNYVALDGPLKLCEPVDGGVYLATASRTWFAPGADFGAAELVEVGPFGAIPGTAAREPNSTAVWWFTPRGAAKGSSAGQVELKQDANIAFGTAAHGAGLYREENGLSQVISTLSSTVPSGAASAASYMDAEVVN